MDNQPTKSKQRPECVGMGDIGMTNLSERVDELLYANLSDDLKNLEDYEQKLLQFSVKCGTDGNTKTRVGLRLGILFVRD